MVRVAKLCCKDGASLGMVSQAFRRHWNSQIVRRECNLNTMEFDPAIGDDDKVSSLKVAMTHFCQAGNVEALYREGLTSLFDVRRDGNFNVGFSQLHVASNSRHAKALYIYGLLLVIKGGDRLDEGLYMLSALKKLTLLKTLIFVTEVRNSLYLDIDTLDGGIARAKDLLIRYDECSCDDGYNRDYMDSLVELRTDALGLFDPPNAPICQNCFWERETTIFYNTDITIELP